MKYTNINTANQICKLEKHFKPVNCVKFSNKYAILISASQNLLFCQPQVKPNTLEGNTNSHPKDL